MEIIITTTTTTTTTYGGFGGESSHDAIGAQLEQMAHPTDFGVWSHLDAFLAVLQRFAVKEDVTQMQYFWMPKKNCFQMKRIINK